MRQLTHGLHGIGPLLEHPDLVPDTRLPEVVDAQPEIRDAGVRDGREVVVLGVHDEAPVGPLRGRFVVAGLYEVGVDDGVHSEWKHRCLASAKNPLQWGDLQEAVDRVVDVAVHVIVVPVISPGELLSSHCGAGSGVSPRPRSTPRRTRRELTIVSCNPGRTHSRSSSAP